MGEQQDFPLEEGILKSQKQWALILGGSSGLGFASAKKLAAHGFNIIIVHRDRKSDLEQFKLNCKTITLNDVELKTFNVDAIHNDKRKWLIQEIATVLSRDGKIKVLVHSIAKGNLKPMRSGSEKILEAADFELTIDAMGVSLYSWSKEMIEANLFASDARIMAFTSEGNTKAWSHYGAVSAAKATLEALMRNMALEYASLGIKVNCIQAGVTDTASFKRIPGSNILKESALMRNPNKRLTTPEDVANVVALLCTDEAKWITGAIIKVDGGESLR